MPRRFAFLDKVPIVAPRLRARALWGFLPEKVTPPPGGPTLGLSFDLDYQKDTDALPGLIDLLGNVGVRATMFGIGKLVEQDPRPYKLAADAGHEVANHTHTHPNNPVLCPDREWWDLSEDEMSEELEISQNIIEDATGQRPVGFRAPHFKTNRHQAGRLQSAGFAYVSDDLETKTPRPTPHPDGGGLTQLPLSSCPGVRHGQFSSYVSIRRPRNPAMLAGLHDVPTWRRLWTKLLTQRRPSGYVNVYFDPMDVMRDAETSDAFVAMLREAVEGGWRVLPCRDVAEAWSQ